MELLLDEEDGSHCGFVLGGGSNIILTRDMPQVVLKVEVRGIRLVDERPDAWIVEAGAGENWHDLVAWTLAQGMPGLENLAMIPGTSRSGATIIGGMLLGLSRKAATEFSFFLAIPTLIGAGVYSLYKERALLSMADLPLFLVGLGFSFVSAWICVRWLLRYISSHSFVVFAWYRIAFGLLVLLTAWTGWVTWAD